MLMENFEKFTYYYTLSFNRKIFDKPDIFSEKSLVENTHNF